MITYKGDRFVKGKTFRNSNNDMLTFITKSKKGFIFESSTDKKQVILEESETISLKEVHRNVKQK